VTTNHRKTRKTLKRLKRLKRLKTLQRREKRRYERCGRGRAATKVSTVPIDSDRDPIKHQSTKKPECTREPTMGEAISNEWV
jgi:hypothetical protein